jgi:ABC-type antimicrobial peptide transport system permease subunit
MQLAAAVRREIWAVDPQQPVSYVRTMEEILASEVSQRSIAMTLLAAFAALALLLAALGIYGVLSYLVAQRRQEIGIRMALGARRMDVLQMVVSEGMQWSIVGVAIGLSAAFALTRVMSSVLYGVSATDPVTFAFVSLLLIVISFIACYVPARRAAKTDPMTTLRCE